ncbi:MAG: class I SAM-dependent methyltransferase [Methanobacteriaceae archaeon]
MKNRDNSTSHLASDFDVQVADTLPYYQSFHEETVNLIKAMDIQPQTWLDTGCGTGTLVNRAIKEFPETKFILCDPSVEMLHQAQQKLKSYPFGDFLFLKPLPTQDFPPELCASPDVITAIQSHHYLSFDKRKMATQACYQLLKEGGVYITFENVRPSTDEGIEIGKRYWKNFQLRGKRDSQAVDVHLARFDREFFPITVEEHLDLLREIGFRVVELFWYSYMQAGFYGIK